MQQVSPVKNAGGIERIVSSSSVLQFFRTLTGVPVTTYQNLSKLRFSPCNVTESYAWPQQP